jgi:hypothetical protein
MHRKQILKMFAVEKTVTFLLTEDNNGLLNTGRGNNPIVAPALPAVADLTFYR